MATVQQNNKLFSASTNHLLGQIETEGETDLLRLMQLLVRIHSEYGDSTREQLFQKYITALEQMPYLGLEQLSREEWVNRVIRIVTPPIPLFKDINGRMFLIAAMLSQSEVIDAQGGSEELGLLARRFIEKMIDELQSQKGIDFAACLTPYGQELKRILSKPHDTRTEEQESLLGEPNISDAPATEDFLSRKPLAGYIANRLREIYEKDVKNRAAFFMQIDGAWGSGKSSLLYFLGKELGKETPGKSDPWAIINFNAWEHQRLSPPWWFLVQSVYREVDRKLQNKSITDWKGLKKWLYLKTWHWQIRTGYVVTALIALIISGGALKYGTFTKNGLEALFIVQLASVAGLIWSTAKSISSQMPLASGASRAAQSFLDANGSDPTQKISELFRMIIEEFDQPVAIFIDDLDRCQHEYGVRLLEGLQTIFRQVPVVYVIAADRRWLNKMYETQYRDFSAAIRTSTKPFGATFLDKVFNYTVALPAITPELQRLYWASLLSKQTFWSDDTTEKKQIEAKIGDPSVPIDAKVRHIDQATDPILKQRYRDIAVSAITIKQQDSELEHSLMPFGDLIEPNPRTMKRLKNDIGTARAIALLYSQRVSQEQLILWTIFKNQHPLLAEYFWDNPAQIESMATGNPEYDLALKDEALKRLFAYQVNKKPITIDAEFIKKMRFQN